MCPLRLVCCRPAIDAVRSSGCLQAGQSFSVWSHGLLATRRAGTAAASMQGEPEGKDAAQAGEADRQHHRRHHHHHHHQSHHHQDGTRPKKLIFAPGDIQPAAGAAQRATITTADMATGTDGLDGLDEMHPHTAPARARQFVTNPPLTISQMDVASPLRQFHAWFRDPRLAPSSAPETCTLATASLPSGRVSSRVLYLKELDERGWVVYSNWGSRAGKGGQVFGADGHVTAGAAADSVSPGSMPLPMPEELAGTAAEAGQGTAQARPGAAAQGNRWASLTFFWPSVERQVRVEGLLEPLSREESELYWRTRERGSQIGAWASWQSKVLWSAELDDLRHEDLRHDDDDDDDGRAVLQRRVAEMEARFADTVEIPLPPFWGGVRLVPESVEFWQGQRSRLHDRFRYVRVGLPGRWRIERLFP